MIKKCFKCGIKKNIDCFYVHKQMADGYLGKCKACTKEDNKASKGKEQKFCLICETKFNTTITEIKRGGGKLCSRSCYYIHLKNTRPREEKSWAWKGNSVGKTALHNWVERNLGKPKKCEHCGSTDKSKKFEWANKSQKYKRDLSDWMRLCTKCHSKYDYSTRIKKWKKSVQKLGWKTK